ncbi:MAG: hypothetical protein AB1646_08885 [Thermodesulfobacteriota bacterium]
MTPGNVPERAPAPSRTRSNRDPVMILLGVVLILFLLTAGYQGVFRGDKKPVKKYRGPVRDPFKVGFLWMFHRDCATLLSSCADLNGRNRSVVFSGK